MACHKPDSSLVPVAVLVLLFSATAVVSAVASPPEATFVTFKDEAVLTYAGVMPASASTTSGFGFAAWVRLRPTPGKTSYYLTGLSGLVLNLFVPGGGEVGGLYADLRGNAVSVHPFSFVSHRWHLVVFDYSSADGVTQLGVMYGTGLYENTTVSLPPSLTVGPCIALGDATSDLTVATCDVGSSTYQTPGPDSSFPGRLSHGNGFVGDLGPSIYWMQTAPLSEAKRACMFSSPLNTCIPALSTVAYWAALGGTKLLDLTSANRHASLRSGSGPAPVPQPCMFDTSHTSVPPPASVSPALGTQMANHCPTSSNLFLATVTAEYDTDSLQPTFTIECLTGLCDSIGVTTGSRVESPGPITGNAGNVTFTLSDDIPGEYDIGIRGRDPALGLQSISSYTWVYNWPEVPYALLLNETLHTADTSLRTESYPVAASGSYGSGSPLPFVVAATAAAATGNYDAVLIRPDLPDGTGTTILSSATSPIEVVLVAAHGTSEWWVVCYTAERLGFCRGAFTGEDLSAPAALFDRSLHAVALSHIWDGSRLRTSFAVVQDADGSGDSADGSGDSAEHPVLLYAVNDGRPESGSVMAGLTPAVVTHRSSIYQGRIFVSSLTGLETPDAEEFSVPWIWYRLADGTSSIALALKHSVAPGDNGWMTFDLPGTVPVTTYPTGFAATIDPSTTVTTVFLAGYPSADKWTRGVLHVAHPSAPGWDTFTAPTPGTRMLDLAYPDVSLLFYNLEGLLTWQLWAHGEPFGVVTRHDHPELSTTSLTETLDRVMLVSVDSPDQLHNPHVVFADLKTPSPSPTPSVTPSATASVSTSPPPTPTSTRSATSSPTASPSSSWTSTRTPSGTPSGTATVSPSTSASASPSSSWTSTPSGTPTRAATPTTSTPSPSSSSSASSTPTSTSTSTSSYSSTVSRTPSLSLSPTFSSTAIVSSSPSPTPTSSSTATQTPSSALTPSSTSTPTATSSTTTSASPTASLTPSPTPTATLSSSPTASATPSSSASVSPPHDCGPLPPTLAGGGVVTCPPHLAASTRVGSVCSVSCPSGHVFASLTTTFTSIACTASGVWLPGDSAFCRPFPLHPFDVSVSQCDGVVRVSWRLPTSTTTATTVTPLPITGVYVSAFGVTVGRRAVNSTTRAAGTSLYINLPVAALPPASATSDTVFSVVSQSIAGLGPGPAATSAPTVVRASKSCSYLDTSVMTPLSTVLASTLSLTSEVRRTSPHLPLTAADLAGYEDVFLLTSAISAPLALGLALPTTPATGESVSVRCVSANPSALTVTPSVQTRDASNAASPMLFNVTAVPASSTLSWPALSTFSVQCSLASPTTGVYASLQPAQFPVHVVNTVVPEFDRVLVHTATGDTVPSSASSVVVSGSINITLVAPPAVGGPRFFPTVVVRFGGVDGQTLGVSSDWRQATVKTPLFDSVCDAACAGAGGRYVSISVHNPARLDPTDTLPPSTVPPSDVAEWVRLSVGASSAFSVSSHSLSAFFTTACVGFTCGPACSDPAATAVCAWGSGASCTQCPTGALCPGGNRLWPRQGWWISGEFQPISDLRRCAAPAAARCLGWNQTAATVACGAGYDASIPECAACASLHFDSGFGECQRCPVTGSGGWKRVARPLGLLVGLLAGVFVVVTGLVFLATRQSGETLAAGARRAVQFVVWTVLTLQVVGQVGHTASPNLPAALLAVYSFVDVLAEFNTPFVHPACLGYSPLLRPIVVMAVTLALLSVACLLIGLRSVHLPCTTCGRRSGRRSQAKMKLSPSSGAAPSWTRFGRVSSLVLRVIFTALTLAYSAAATTVFDMLYCDDASPRRLVSTPHVRCFQGGHRLAFGLSLVVLVVYLIGYPLGSFLWVKQALAAGVAGKGKGKGEGKGKGKGEEEEEQRDGGVKPAVAVSVRRPSTAAIHTNDAKTQSTTALISPANRRMSVRRSSNGRVLSRPSSTGPDASPIPSPRAKLQPSPSPSQPQPQPRRASPSPPVAIPMAFAHFLANDLRPDRFYFRMTDLALLFLLSLLNAVGTSRRTPVFATVAVVNVAAVAVTAAAVGKLRPYDQSWKTTVRVYALVLAGVGAAVNGLAAGADQRDSAGWDRAVLVAASCLFVMALGLFLVLMTSFWMALSDGTATLTLSALCDALRRCCQRGTGRAKATLQQRPGASESTHFHNPLFDKLRLPPSRRRVSEVLGPGSTSRLPSANPPPAHTPLYRSGSGSGSRYSRRVSRRVFQSQVRRQSQPGDAAVEMVGYVPSE